MEDAPIDLVRTVEHSFKVLDWYENLLTEEVPPQWMWTVEHELELWFERVERDREAKYGGGGSGSDDDDMGQMMRNELADEIRGK